MTAPSAEEMTPLRRGLILLTLTMSTALYAMTVTIANVSLPQIQGALSATQDQIAWIVTFNIVATAVATPMTGWLAARYGRRNVMLYGVLGFTIATLLCGLATGLVELVVYRVIQGACGAPLVPLSQAIVLDSYPKERHGFATAVYGVGVVLGPIVAPTIGGYLSEAYSWRWVFFMVVPIGVVCFVGVWFFILDRRRGPARLDWTGFLALSVAIASAQLLLDRGERNDWFESWETIIEAGLVVAAAYVFLVNSFLSRQPFLNPKILYDRNFTLGLVIVLIFGMLNFTPMVLLPTMLQGLQNYPDSVVGILLGARAIGTLCGFSVMLFASHIDPRIWMVLGFGAQGVAGVYMSHFGIEVGFWPVALASALQGLGVGLLWVPITLVAFSTLNPVFLAEGTAIFHLIRNIGSSLHISLSVALVIRYSQVNYAELGSTITPYNETLQLPSVSGGWSVDSLRGIASLSGEVGRQAAMVGYVNAFLLYGITALLVIPLIFFIQRNKPK
ncbi:MAG: DHA2 family efflux MFS transporter permease subunit [Gammaproteobacteria bacterium]|nr:DHA2 family efflux MFS transporter permease subunit [Gammaproteobacteria bacterium]